MTHKVPVVSGERGDDCYQGDSYSASRAGERGESRGERVTLFRQKGGICPSAHDWAGAAHKVHMVAGTHYRDT